MYDRETDSVWLQIGGRAIKGALANTQLTSGPLLDTTWRRWKRLHPDTLVMAPDKRYLDAYEPNGVLTARGYKSFPSRYFRRSLTHQDTRLASFDMVLALAVPNPPAPAPPPDSPAVRPIATADAANSAAAATLYRAYPFAALKKLPGALNDVVGNQPLVVFYEAESATAVAFSRVLDGATLTFETRRVAGQTLAFDRETGSRWNIEGKAETGPLQGRTLPTLNSHLSEWYGWVSYFPQTSIYGRSDPPKPLKTAGRLRRAAR